MTDSSVLDNFEMTGIDCEGDEREVQIVMCYDVDCDCYTVEKFIDGKHADMESFDSSGQASAFFARWVKDTEKHYADERAEYERVRLALTVEALRDLVNEYVSDIDPDAAQAITLLAELISRGKAKDVRDDLEWSLATIYRHDLVG